jgi:MIP family channel proteins
MGLGLLRGQTMASEEGGLRIFGFHLKLPIPYDAEDDHWQSLWRCGLAEFFGTLIFVFLGCGSVTSAFWPPSPGGATPEFVLAVALAHGFAITIAIYSIGEISGGNINPAVSWALMITRKISIVRCVVYWFCQLLGAVLAAAVLHSLLPSVEWPPGLGAAQLLGCHGKNESINVATALTYEICLTFIFIFVVFATAISPFVGKMAPVSGGSAEYGPGKLTPLVLGLTILVLHLVGVTFTGASMNPARSFGPALIGACWDDHWIYWAGPLVGSTSAAIIANVFFLSSPDSIARVFAITRGNKSLENVRHHKSNRVAPADGAGVGDGTAEVIRLGSTDGQEDE